MLGKVAVDFRLAPGVIAFGVFLPALGRAGRIVRRQLGTNGEMLSLRVV